jgi:hypothetical protein
MPRLLETHGCQGGAHAGYVRAGWEVTGVDIDRRHAKYYPGELIIADAATYIREHGHEYDAIHTSPPCQWYVRKGGYVPRDKAVVKALLGIEHDMTWNGLYECLPPAYTEHIGRQLIDLVAEAAV